MVDKNTETNMKLQDFLKEHNLTIEELDQIIKEETEKIQKSRYLSELLRKRERIMEELEACESDDLDENLDELMGMFKKKTPEQKFAETEANLMAHPVKAKHMEKLKAENPEKYRKYVEFWMENPRAAHIQWNEQKQQYEDKGLSSTDAIVNVGQMGIKTESKKVKKGY